MATRVELLGGFERLEATTRVLQRIRRSDAEAGIWDAFDVQWWWRRPRPSDEVALPVWSDAAGPCAAVCFTDWGDGWQADALVADGAVPLPEVWGAALDAMAPIDAPSWEVLAREDDAELLDLLTTSGFVATDEGSGTTWMDAEDRAAVSPPPDGFVITDRASSPDRPHPMAVRNGEAVEERLRQCSLYDPELDLAIDGPDGRPAGYALFWYDATTGVGMLEPMRVEDEFQRRGLARALLTEGLDRLVGKGARRLKVGFDGEPGRRLYEGAGFRVTSWVRSYRRSG